MLTPSGRGGETGPSSEMQSAISRLVGSLVAGKYRVKRLLGHGGMGSVYKAENVAIGRTVALKVLHTHLADDGVTLARFQREARLAASAGHDHIVEILDMGVEPSGAPYIVMEYVRGQSLGKLLASEPPFEVVRAARVAGGILAALGAVHTRGIVHRDLKPENVMLTTKGGQSDFVKLFDFGISTFVEAALDPSGPLDLTPSGRTMGTPFYASPEQISGERGRDARVDIWAVGVLLYQMLVGKKPFEGRNFPELCRAILESTPVHPRAIRPELPEALDAVVMRALEKDPGKRFQSASAMAAALVPFGAVPLAEEPEPTDTFTWDMRELRAREAVLRGAGARPGSDPPEGLEGTAAVRGEVLSSLLEFLRDRLGGPRFERLIDDTEPSVRAVLRARLDPSAWYPGSALCVLEIADRSYAGGDRRLIADAGRSLARRSIGRDPGALVRTVTPELLFAMTADLWRRFFAGGEPKVTTASRGLGRLEIRGATNGGLVRAVAMMGFLDEALTTAGARDVDVRLASAAALGDPADVYEATWSS
ncbi:serine/threonine-protein kinase [Sandaracinus amylolyticus]|uniref:serine/threonine-protein kinase n=1 Tax=Sandaracinus amylolyticus TaxID=927083 RepID=UPI001F3DBF26|nr:serine/threonine-protein kinase [Sandaracinus amylolyticus]